MGIIVNCDPAFPELDQRMIDSLVALGERVLQAHHWDKAEVGLTFTDDETIQQLNKEYRGIDAPTDVLSFALEEGEEGPLEYGEGEDSPPVLLGDIVISLPRAKEQAREYGHSLEREVLYLAVHGLLHLLGYDHQHAKDKQVMRAEEERFLQAEGWSREDEE